MLHECYINSKYTEILRHHIINYYKIRNNGVIELNIAVNDCRIYELTLGKRGCANVPGEPPEK